MPWINAESSSNKNTLAATESTTGSRYFVLLKIQKCVDSFVLPSDLGHIPNKISSGFTADQWKNWSLYFSIIVLRDILPEDILECWRHFVLACRLLTSFQISSDEIKLGDALLLQFCKRTERLFGKASITPDMHMHWHE